MTESAHLQPVTLSGHGVRLEPLSFDHAAGLVEASADGDLGALNYTNTPLADADAVSTYIRAALDGRAAGTMLPFAVLRDDGEILGSTRYYDIDASAFKPRRVCALITWTGRSRFTPTISAMMASVSSLMSALFSNTTGCAPLAQAAAK